MPLPSPHAETAARRLIATAGAPSETAALGAAPGGGTVDAVAAAGRAATELAETLARWFGPYGTYALFSRALVRARAAHAALAYVQIRGPLVPALDGVEEAVRTCGAAATVDAVAALLAAAVDLLGRMIGDDMAMQLVQRSLEGSVPHVPDESRTPPAPSGAGGGEAA